MPRVIACTDDAAAEPEEVADALATDPFDPRDEDSVARSARWLRRLGNNRSFLADRIVAELTGAGESQASLYGAQVIMLSRAVGNCFLRANIWPAKGDALFRASGGDVFAYDLPHDHNFDFLTVGYHGPGYWSDYWEYDHAAVDGWRGEPAGLRFVERSRLAPERLMHYRAHRDVHRQLPPDALSVSLNIMHMAPGQGWRDQYRFDIERNAVASILTETGSEIALRLACALDHAEGLALAEHWGRHHESDRARLSAFSARALHAADNETRDAIWREAELCGSRLVAIEAWRHREAMERAAIPAQPVA